MSIVLAVASTAFDSTHGGIVLAQDAGIIDWANAKLADVGGLIRVAAGVIAVCLFLSVVIKSRGAFVPIVLAGLTAAVAVYFAWNIDGSVQDRVDNEVNAGGTSSVAPLLAGGDGAAPAVLLT